MNKTIVLFIFLLGAGPVLEAQSSDELFKNAREAAFDQHNYEKAKRLAIQALERSPSYSEIEIFLGRVYSWNDQNDSARYRFSKVLSDSPPNEEASIAFSDLEYWNGDYRKALEIVDKALEANPASAPLLLRKTKIRDAGKELTALNKITVNYDHTSFDKQFDQPWQMTSIGYGRTTTRGSVIARVNIARRFGENGLQGEVDAYPSISKTFYGYVNLGYSGNVGVFPNFRAGFSLYAKLPASFEAEAGLRYLYFTSPTYVYTFAIGKYYKNFLFTLRTYQTPSDFGVSQSYSLNTRYYLKEADDYIGLTLGSGISPDENTQIILFNKRESLSAKQVSASFYHTFLKWNILSLGGGLINEEYRKGATGNQLDIWVGLSHRF